MFTFWANLILEYMKEESEKYAQSQYFFHNRIYVVGT